MEQKDDGRRVIAIALNGGSKSLHIVKWALEKFNNNVEIPVKFKLIHVFSKINGVPTPMGNLIPFSQVRDDVVAAYKKEIEWQKNELILPFQRMLTRYKVLAEVVLLESDEIWNAISMELAKGEIKDLVIGASSNSLFARKFRGQSLSSLISESAPGFCTIYVVSKGKLEALRPSQTDQTKTASVEYDSSAPGSTFTSARFTNSSLESNSTFSESSFEPLPRLSEKLESESYVNNVVKPGHPSKNSPVNTSFKPGNNAKVVDDSAIILRSRSQDSSFKPAGNNAKVVDGSAIILRSRSQDSSFKPGNNAKVVDDSAIILRSRSQDSESRFNDQASTSSCHSISSIEEQQTDFEGNAYVSQKCISSELEKLKIELRHIRGMYSLSQNETEDATRKLSDLNRLRQEEGLKLKQIEEKEEIAKVLAKLEKEKFEAAKREAECARECALREAFQRREAELKGARDVKEKLMLKTVFDSPVEQYQTFTWEEIVSATCSFSEQLKIGEGSSGTVYKCRLNHTSVAIKVLHSKVGVKSKQFLKELEMLSKIRHPHLLLLLGACPEHGCLVYEYMENGTLEDRLFQKNNTPPIPWYERFRIVREIASALAFLHNNRSNPNTTHGALKPANIFLDHNFITKIRDAKSKCINPEHQQFKASVKDDIWALGIIIWQLLTAKPALGITRFVESAMKEGRLMNVLDNDAGRWPFRETAELALLGVRCADVKSRDRPDLKDKILPLLERIQEVADRARDLAAGVLVAPPTHFICPILQDVMEDPCVASDGYTYDRKAIELWIKDNDTSPTTNFPLANKHLIPNNSLLYAIMEWKSERKLQTRKHGSDSRF
ncbi:U-box domain-containing protein 35-like [Silene latifolia]|uniref:U-box domain-containing protein 35-like n=1 Tax=Silene latifolia TaxID=37657 RepID=UPI003D77A3C6